jgi:TetR/AcrR family transcriptional regulator
MESGGSGVRTRILRAATDVFSDKGYAGASIADISSAARVTKPMLYYYFGDKAGLFDAVIEQVHGRLESALHARTREGVNAVEQLGDIAELVFAASREDPTVSRLKFAAFFGTSTGGARETLTSSADLVYRSILDVVEQGIASGELSGPAEELTLLVQGAIDMRVLSFLAAHDPRAIEAGEGLKLVALLVRGIGHPTPARVAVPSA